MFVLSLGRRAQRVDLLAIFQVQFRSFLSLHLLGHLFVVSGRGQLGLSLATQPRAINHKNCAEDKKTNRRK